MKRKFLSSLAAVFLALSLVLAGVAVPRLLIHRQADRLTNKSELLSSDQLTPYSAGADSPVRIQKLSNMTTALLSDNGSIDLYFDLREPLDTELSLDAAIQKAAAFLADLLTTVEEMGLEPLSNPNFFDSANEAGIAIQEYFAQEEAPAKDEGQSLSVLLEESFYEGQFVASPEDSSLAMWSLSFDGPYCGCHLLIDAVTGLPIYFSWISTTFSDETGYLFAVIHAYQALFPDRFSDFGSDVSQSFESRIPAAQGQDIEAYGYDSESEPEDLLCYSTRSGDITLRLELDYTQSYHFIPVFRLYA